MPTEENTTTARCDRCGRPVRDGVHHYLSTGCLHGDTVLPDGRTGHQYCQGHTGNAGTKKPASCKFCQAPCQCPCHQTTESETPR